MQPDAGDVVALLAVIASLVVSLLTWRASGRRDARQEKVEERHDRLEIARLLAEDNVSLRSEVKELRDEVAEMRSTLAGRRVEHHRCLEEVQAVRMHLLLIARAIPSDIVPAELRAYIRSLEGDP